ncbi:Iron-sulfur cluster assembly accessory protein [Arachidicoccus rhizosphaerae]|jgi:iron-sulfur cluster assembly protein|uniref:Iron-sulfur cluster assembly accessory protein n=1 Tax=Arachidicoccus rhizosphaerae TaxID=551991 RepID=A0A1H4B5P5_9BACT|nr:iron-sulfur cluster biosynthesis family protein [Arachidicoccus rhizosphaerae]SEA43278.1 Iron-sulfur cluster assembly accessory protein [Arachidicoccus rhizosphaerae]
MDLIEVTPAALEQLEALRTAAAEQGNPYLRIGARGGGCGVAVTYYLGFDKAESTDQIFTTAGLDCVINKAQLMQLQGITLDYLDSDLQQGFKFIPAGR